jgi:hypothetical protein
MVVTSSVWKASKIIFMLCNLVIYYYYFTVNPLNVLYEEVLNLLELIYCLDSPMYLFND